MEAIQQAKVDVFFKHLARAYGASKKRQDAHQKIDTHIEKLKKAYTQKKPSAKKVTADFNTLSKHMRTALDLEKPKAPKKSYISADVKQRIDELNRTFSTYVHSVEERKEKIKHLEQRIQQKSARHVDDLDVSVPAAAKIPSEIKQRLAALEEKYYALKMEGTSASELKPIKQRIDQLKQRV